MFLEHESFFRFLVHVNGYYCIVDSYGSLVEFYGSVVDSYGSVVEFFGEKLKLRRGRSDG